MNVSPFKGRGLRKAIGSSTTGSSSFFGGLFLGSASGGGGAYTNCKTDDDSLYCRMIRYRSIFSNVLFFIIIFVVFVCIIYFVIVPYLSGGKKGRGKR